MYKNLCGDVTMSLHSSVLMLLAFFLAVRVRICSRCLLYMQETSSVKSQTLMPLLVLNLVMFGLSFSDLI